MFDQTAIHISFFCLIPNVFINTFFKITSILTHIPFITIKTWDIVNSSFGLDVGIVIFIIN